MSKQLQKEADFYKNFIEVQDIYKFVMKLSLSLRIINYGSLILQGGGTVKDFCATEVEPMFRESDHIHIIGESLACGAEEA